MNQRGQEWAIGKLEDYLKIITITFVDRAQGLRPAAPYWKLENSPSEVQAASQVAEQIIDRVLPGWRKQDWGEHFQPYSLERQAATRAIAQLKASQELADYLGSSAPQLDASTMHPWVWGSVQGLWSSGHYRQAVAVAAVAVNAQTQAKVDRKDLSEWKLLNDAFSIKDPEPGKPRLRLAPKEDSDTWRSRHEGAGAFARGVYSAIRNPIAHEQGEELTENEALEMLAAFSLLAKWVDEAVVDRGQ